MWGLAALPLGVYAIVQNLNIPLILQPQLFALLSLISWAQASLKLRQTPDLASHPFCH